MPTKMFAEGPNLFLEGPSFVLELLPLVILVAIVFGTMIFIYTPVKPTEQVQQHRSSSRETLFRESEYTEVIAENDHGYGVAVRDVDEGAELVSFNDRDEIYQNVWISADELPETADALSERAVQKTELQDER